MHCRPVLIALVLNMKIWHEMNDIFHVEGIKALKKMVQPVVSV